MTGLGRTIEPVGARPCRWRRSRPGCRRRRPRRRWCACGSAIRSATSVMKNCEPLVPGRHWPWPAGTGGRTADRGGTRPRTCSPGRRVPVPRGSPPWSMKFEMTRWNVRAVVERLPGDLAGGGVQPFLRALGETDEVVDGLGRVVGEQLDDDVTQRGREGGGQGRCHGGGSFRSRSTSSFHGRTTPARLRAGFTSAGRYRVRMSTRPGIRSGGCCSWSLAIGVVVVVRNATADRGGSYDPSLTHERDRRARRRRHRGADVPRAAGQPVLAQMHDASTPPSTTSRPILPALCSIRAEGKIVSGGVDVAQFHARTIEGRHQDLYDRMLELPERIAALDVPPSSPPTRSRSRGRSRWPSRATSSSPRSGRSSGWSSGSSA